MKEIDSNQENEVFTKNDAFEKKVLERGGNKAAIGRNLGNVSGQLIGQYIQGRQKPKEDFFKKWEAVYKENIRPLFETNVSHEIKKPLQSQSDNGTEPTPLQLMKIIIDTNESIRKDHSELIQLHKQIVATNSKLADSNNELAKKIPDQPTVNVQQQSEQVVDATRSAFLELLSQVGSGKRFHSPDEVKTIYNKLVADVLVPKAEDDTQKNSGKKRILK